MNRKVGTVALCLVLLGGGVAAAEGGQTAVHGCVGNFTEIVRMVDESDTCDPLETARSWNSAGPVGRTGTGALQFRSFKTDIQSQTPSAGPYTPVVFQAEIAGAGSAFDSATGSFVATAAGVYSFGSRVFATGTRGVYELVLVVNGDHEAWLDIQTKTDTQDFVVLSGRTRRTLDAGDRVQVGFQSTGDATLIGRFTRGAERPGQSIFVGYKTD